MSGCHSESVIDDAEYRRWQAAAADALRAADVQAGAGLHNWACFLAEQAAELGLQGFLHGVGAGAWGHDLVALGEALAAQVGADGVAEIIPALRRLSRHYIPARYPDAHPAGSPREHYGAEDADQAAADTRLVLGAVAGWWAELANAAQGRAGRMRTEVVLARRRRERQDRIDRARRFAAALSTPGLRAVVVLGSVARGDFNQWSDIDVLVVAEELSGPPHLRADALGPAPGGIQVIAWTPGEWAAARGRANPIVVESLDCGIWLFGGPDALP